MNTKFFLFFIFIFSFFQNYGQSTDLDRYYYNTKDVRIPSIYTEPNLRSYSISHNGNLPVAFDPSRVKINGFVQNNSDGTYKLFFTNITNYTFSNPEIVERKEEIKDKDKKVTGYKYYYKVVVDISITGTGNFEGNGEKYSFSLIHKENFYTNEYPTSKQASDNYNLINSTWLSNFKNNYEPLFYSTINYAVNSRFGFGFEKIHEMAWILGSEKHPEYEKHQEALTILKKQFALVDFEKLPDDILSGLQPAIDIFNNQINAYKEDNKKDKKIRYAAYYNLMNLYLNIDDFSNAEKYANLLIVNDYDDGDGKTMLKRIAELKEKMLKNKVNSTHFEIQNEKGFIY